VCYSDREATQDIFAPPSDASGEQGQAEAGASTRPDDLSIGASSANEAPAAPSAEPTATASSPSSIVLPSKPPRTPLPALANGAESPLIRHNQLGETYTIKLVYPGFYLGMSTRELTTTIGFPLSKERLAKRVTPGHLFFIYVTSPERRVIGLAQATGHAAFTPEQDFKRPWSVQLAWLIGPKSPGVGFADIGLQIKARIGDTTYSITDEVAAALIDRLQDMNDLSSLELSRLKEKYRLFC